LISVGGKGTVGRSLREVQNLLLGPPGSALTLGIASGARDPSVSVLAGTCFKKTHPTSLQDITVVRAKMPPLVRSGDAGTGARQGARAIARDMLGQMSAPLDQPVLPFDDTWIREIKVSVVQPGPVSIVPCIGALCHLLDSARGKCESYM
jgi:hypothetical protein